REILHHLDDVAVRIPDPELGGGAVAVGEDLRDPLELALRAELARVRLEVPQRAADELRDRNAVAPPGREVHDGRLEAVARGEPLVLADEDAVPARHLAA